MQLGNSRQQGSAEMTQQVRAVTLYFWTHYSGSYPVATTNAQARISLTPEPIWEQHGTANTAQHGTWAGFPEKSQPRVLVDNQLPKVWLRTLRKRSWSTLNSVKFYSLEWHRNWGKQKREVGWVVGLRGSVPDVLQIDFQSCEINHGNNNKNSKIPSNDYFFLFFSSCNALASIWAECCHTRYFVSCLFTSGLSYIHHQST